jgi:hypothetical protein
MAASADRDQLAALRQLWAAFGDVRSWSGGVEGEA